MKTVLSIFLTLSTSFGFGQDIITLLTAEEIKAKVIEVTPDLIKYNLFGTDAPLYSIHRSTVFSIKYSDGRIELITKPVIIKQVTEDTTQEEPDVEAVIVKPKVDYCYQGELDAYNYHRRGFGNFALGFFFPILGSIGVAASEPAPPPPNVPTNSEVRANQDYMDCYARSAKKQNINNAVTGALISIALTLTLIAFQ